jgi:GH35 family endo-1,4-beta-xylanase
MGIFLLGWRLSRMAALSTALWAFSAACAEDLGRELLKNGSFAGADAGGKVPASWQGSGSPGVEWPGPEQAPLLALKAGGPNQAPAVRQEMELPRPLPAALMVRAKIKMEDIRRGDKSWYSGRILVTYLDDQDKALGETYTLDRLEGSSDWKEVKRQFPVLPGAVKVRLELQLLNAAGGSLLFRQVSLRALDKNQAQEWRKDAEARILKYRTAPLRLQVEDAAGKPLPGADVAVFMRRHAYPFGTAVKSKLLTLPPGDPHTDTYRSVFEHFFNYGTLEGELKAPPIERNGMGPALDGLAWMKDHGIARRGHVLTWPSFEMSAKAVAASKDDPERVRELMKKHFHEVLVATAPYDIVDWDVVNEPAYHNDLIRLLGDKQVVEWFRWAKKDAPRARLFLNENNVEFQSGNGDELEKWIRMLQEAKAPLEGIGWQGHMWHRTLPSGQNILDDLDRFAPYGLPVQITEYDTHERFSDEDEARFLDEFLTAWFSHPLTDGFIMWGFQDSYMWNGNGPLFRDDWSLKPSGKVWMELVFGKWWTERSGRSDGQGRFEVRGYLGDYEVEVRQGGRRIHRKVELGREGKELVVRLDGQADRDDPSTRLASSNPYRGGKLPAILPPKKQGDGAAVQKVSLGQGQGAYALVPAPANPDKAGRLVLEGSGDPLQRKDLYLRFDPGNPAPGSISKAALHLQFEPLAQPLRVQVYVLSPRFVPQGREAGLGWKSDDMALGRAPGRSAETGEYRLGDASVLYLGEQALPVGASELRFSTQELARAAQAAGGKGVTVILSTSGDRWAVFGPGHTFSTAPVLELGAGK